MYIRCPSCKASSRLEMGRSESKARCGRCGRIWSLASIGDLGATPQERFEKAEAFSVEKSIDLASAYSVLLGLMAIDDACFLSPRSSKKAGFGEANVTEGDRVMRASSLAQRHGISISLAFDVAAGKLPLEEALRRKRERDPSRLIKPRARARRTTHPRVWLAPVAVGLAVAGALLLLDGQKRAARPPRTATPRVAREAAQPSHDVVLPAVHVAAPSFEPTPAAVETTVDAEGRITLVRGRTPISVLEAFCAASQGQEACEPAGIESARPHVAGVRVGVLDKKWDPGYKYAIWIRRDPDGKSWFAGTGLKPLQPERIVR